jgi:ribosome biogenesis GTPase
MSENDGAPARISAVARDRLEAFGPDGPVALTLRGGESTGDFAVGDWVIHDPQTGRVTRRLDRATLLQRRAAGTDVRQQVIAANVDTLGIVTSCNADFNPARLERYLALAASAGCLPLVIITKADAVEDPDAYRHRAEALSPLVAALALDARDPDEVARLGPWCNGGQTLALLGSSGVGKTTLSNTLTGHHDATQGIREDDAKGRHTTTARALWRTVAGGWLIDTPGMRALRLSDAADGIDSVFADLSDLATQCRFADCTHDGEPGCAIQAEITAGRVEADRLHRWRKLQREDARNSESIFQSRARDRAFGKMVRSGQSRGRNKRGD